MKGQLSSRRYEIRRVLGEGGTGVVYEAHDSRDDTIVALKTIDARSAENLYRLKREFRALADLQHKNLVRFGELSCEEGQWFFSMELVHGKSFLAYVRPDTGGPQPIRADEDATTQIARRPLPTSGVVERAAPSRPPPTAVGFDEGRLRAVLEQLVSALAVLHEAGHVHRDVKPSNVLVADDGRVVLLDFGLVTALAGRTSGGDGGWLVGTPLYMAPEQIVGGAVGPEADWYALGIMLFQALTGTLPFEGSANAVLETKLSLDGPAPRHVVPDVPVDLDALCVALLRTDPSLRPDVAQIRASLGIAPSGVEISASMIETAPAFVGRDAELAALRSAFEQSRRARGAHVVVVEGEPGMGKSSLVQHFVSTLPNEALVLSGRCYEQETVPFKGVDSMIDALSEWLIGLTDREVASLVAGGVRYLATVFPVLHRVDAIAAATRDARDVANVSALREQAFGEMERLFGALAARGPLVVYLDDLQWADHDSLALLRRALLQPNGPRCLFVATLRDGIDVPAPVTEILASATRLALRGLSEPESRALLDTLWTQRARRTEVLSQRDTLVREAAGHPLFLAELVRSARAGFVRAGGETKLQEVLWERIQERDPIERRFLELVAVAGAPTPYEVLAKAAQVDVGECQTRLGSLRAAQLIRVSRRADERLVEPYHDRVREAVLHHISETEPERGIASRHLQLGRTLLDAVPDGGLPARVFAVAHHMNAARALLADRAEEIRVATLNLAAARQAHHATAYEHAQGYARAGLALLGNAGWTDAYDVARDLHALSMAAELYAGDDVAAKRCFEAARAHLATAEERTNLYVAWVGLQTSLGRLNDAIQTGSARLGELGLTLRPRVGTVAVLFEYLRNRIAQRGRTTDELLHVPALRDPVQEGIMRLLAALVPAAFFVSQNLIALIQLKMAGITMRHGACDVSAYGFVGQGTVLAGAFQKHAEAGAFGRLALAFEGRFRNVELAPRLTCVYGGWLASWTQPFRHGKESLRKSFDLAQQCGDTAWETYAATVLSVVTFCESTDLAGVESTAVWAREIAARRKDRDMAGVGDAHARYAAVLRGSAGARGPDAGTPDLTVEGSSDAELRASLAPTMPTATFYYYFCNAELAYAFGDTARAASLLEEAGRRTNVIFALPTMVELALLEALVAARAHDDAPAIERFFLRRKLRRRVGDLRRWARSSPENFEPHYLVAYAELLRARGATSKAVDAYARAVTASRAYGSTKREALALERAHDHARRCGDTARAAKLAEEAIEAYRRWGATAKADALATRANANGSANGSANRKKS